MTQSPNDQGRMHSILHACYKSPQFRYDDAVSDPLGNQWTGLKALLNRYLEPSSFRTIWKCLSYAESFLNKAFSLKNVKSAFKKAGIFPFNPKRILGVVTPHFQMLDQEDADEVFNSIDYFVPIVEENGFVPEDDYDCYFENANIDGVILDNKRDRKGKPLNELAVNRQR
jgi:hypothetical protein